MLELIFLLIHKLIQAIQPLIVPICFVFAWLLMFLIGWSLWSAFRDGVKNARQMHQIPCSSCQFFTQNYQLKCPVHPTKALSIDAINCPDYMLKAYMSSSNSDTV
jgi:hypothetical protein